MIYKTMSHQGHLIGNLIGIGELVFCFDTLNGCLKNVRLRPKQNHMSDVLQGGTKLHPLPPPIRSPSHFPQCSEMLQEDVSHVPGNPVLRSRRV